MLKGNLLTSAPFSEPLPEVKTLDLSANKITTLPFYICKMTKLTSLSFEGNPLVDPPLEIAIQGLQAIKYFFESDKVVLQEAKIVLVGNGVVGKTSLALNLRDFHRRHLDYLNIFTKRAVLPKEDERTVGIDVYDFELPDSPGVTLHVWDMAGQLEYQPYHQSFFSERSVNIVVWKVNDLLHKGFPSVAHEIKRWLGSIASSSARWRKASNHFGPDQRDVVLLVGNVFSNDKDFADYEIFLKPVLSQVSSFATAVCNQCGLDLVAFSLVNCREGTGIPEVRTLLSDLVKSRVRLELPAKFVALKADLTAWHPVSKGFVVWTQESFEKFAHKVGGLSVPRSECLVALRTLHNLGFLFYKPEANLVILNPRAIPKISGHLIRKFYPPAKKLFVSKGQIQIDHILDERSRSTLFRSMKLHEGLQAKLFDVMLQMGFFFEDCHTSNLIFPFTLSPEPPANPKRLLIPKGHLEKRVVFHTKSLLPLGFIYQLALIINKEGRERGIKIEEIWQRGLRLTVLKTSVFSFITMGHADDSVFLDVFSLPQHLPRFKKMQTFLVASMRAVLTTESDLVVQCAKCLGEADSLLPRYPTEFSVDFHLLGGPASPLSESETGEGNDHPGLLVLRHGQDLRCSGCGFLHHAHSLLEPLIVEDERKMTFEHAEHSTYGKTIYEIYRPEERDYLYDVVFIHGLTGHPWKTWTNSQETFWPKEWLSADLGKHARILTVGYLSSFSLWQRHYTTPLQERTGEIFRSLLDCGVGQRPLFLVGHSLGGLQIKSLLAYAQDQALEQSMVALDSFGTSSDMSLARPKLKHYKVFEKEYEHKMKKRATRHESGHSWSGESSPLGRREQRFLDNCRGVVFYGVPHLGSNLASFMISLSSITHPTQAIHDLHPTSKSLVSLQEDFLRLCGSHPFLKTNVLNFIEQDKVFGVVQVVEMWSSTLPSQFINVPLDKSHIDICTPESVKEESYSLLLKALLSWVQGSVVTLDQLRAL